jgi:hypothetical protein
MEETHFEVTNYDILKLFCLLRYKLLCSSDNSIGISRYVGIMGVFD